MARAIAVGIDIGTHQVKVAIAEEFRDGGRALHKIIGRGTAESRGLRNGYIANSGEAAESVAQAVRAAEKQAQIEVKRAFVSIGGIGLSGVISSASILISHADLEVSERDKEEALKAAEAAIPSTLTQNRKIINTIPLEYKIDGKPVWGRAEGLRAQKLEVKALFITCLEHHLEDLIRTVEAAGVEVVDVVAAPVAASFVTISKLQKKAGCLLANIGAETLSIVVFENGIPVSMEVFPLGSADLTNTIALGLKIPLEEAERVKLGDTSHITISKKKLDDMVKAHLRTDFEHIAAHLKKINRHALLPAGIIMTGGGSGLMNIADYAEDMLSLPACVADVHYGSEPVKQKDAIWSVAYGLTLVGFNSEDERGTIGTKPFDTIRRGGKNAIQNVLDWFSRFLP